MSVAVSDRQALSWHTARDEGQARSWQPALDGEHAVAAVTLATAVATRLQRHEDVEAAARLAESQSNLEFPLPWRPASIAQGYTGLALLCAYFDDGFPGYGWDQIAYQHLVRAAQGAEADRRLGVGIHSGLAGLAFAAPLLSRGGSRYQRLLAQLDARLVPLATDESAVLAGQRHDISMGQFDVISGLAGVGAYLLLRRDEPEPAAALTETVRALVVMSNEDDGLPRWHTPPHLLFDDTVRDIYRYGNLNCGLAHGIPGPLALLALAHRAGVQVDGLPEAIVRIADWLADHRLDDAWGVNWPNAVPLSGPNGHTLGGPGVGPSRAAWCYGAPGVARAIWLAGEALGRQDYCDLAVLAMDAVIRRPIPVRQIDSPTFCHGVAGLLQIVLRFAHDTRLPRFATAARELTAQLLSMHEPASLLGFRSIEREGRCVDQPGLLDGAPGVALVLLAAATDVEPAWDRLFLLS